MNIDKNKIKNIAIPGCILILFFWVLQNFSLIGSRIGFLINLLLPFLIGGAIAFVLNIPMRMIETLLFQNVKKENPLYRFKRIISYIITLALVCLVIFLVIVIVIPQLTITVQTLATRLPKAMESLQQQVDTLMEQWPDFIKMTGNIDIDWASLTNKAFSGVQSGFTKVLGSSFSIIGSVVSIIVNTVVAFIFSIYLLMQKEKLSVQVKKILFALLPQKVAQGILNVADLSYVTFSNFFSGQCLEACILGLLFFIAMTIMGLPYAVLIAVLLAFTALIPVVGAFIGCVVGVLLIATVAPIKAVEFLVLFLVLQQIEGNLIYPHVVGGSVGLPSIWVLVAVTVGGNLFGIVGILLFIPFVSVIYTLFRTFIYDRLRKKNISSDFFDTKEEKKVDKSKIKKSKKSDCDEK